VETFARLSGTGGCRKRGDSHSTTERRDLEEAIHQLPDLAAPLSVPSIRSLVRNPFYLDLAARLNWTGPEATPAGELAFRDKAWREVVCREDEAIEGLPLERDRVMVELAFDVRGP